MPPFKRLLKRTWPEEYRLSFVRKCNAFGNIPKHPASIAANAQWKQDVFNYIPPIAHYLRNANKTAVRAKTGRRQIKYLLVYRYCIYWNKGLEKRMRVRIGVIGCWEGFAFRALASAGGGSVILGYNKFSSD